MDTMTYASYGALRAIIAQSGRVVLISEPEFTGLDLATINTVS